MIYKPTSASPNLEIVPIEQNQTSLRFELNGIASSKLLRRVNIVLSGDANTSDTDYENNSYKNMYMINVQYENDTYCVSFNPDINWLGVKKNSNMTWKSRLYEYDSFLEDALVYDDLLDIGYPTDNSNYPIDYENNYPYYSYQNNYRKGMFNYELAYEDAGRSTKLYGDEFYYTTNYVPTSWIGYGNIISTQNAYLTGATTINDAPISSSSSGNRNNNYKLIKIFPHDFHNWLMFGYDSSSVSKTQQYTTGYDNFYSRYYIKIRGYYFKILDFRYYNWCDIDDANPSDNLEGNTDGYGNALSMYVLIKTPSGFTINENDTYTIYSNYIDTDSYSFEMNDVADITFIDKKFASSPISFYKTQSDAMTNENAYNLNYSNLEIEGAYKQNSGAYLSKYNVTLNRIDENGNMTIIDRVANRFSQSIYYNFDEFKNGEKYLLKFEIVNNRNVIDERYLCIETFYGQETNLIKATTTFNQSDNSVIIDFNNIFSISPIETIENAHSFKTENDNLFLCIDSNNSLTYNKIDGEGNLTITNLLANIVIKLHDGFYGEIAYVKDDYNNEYTLSWDGLQFIYEVTKASETVIYHYYPFSYEISDETTITNNPWLTKMIDNMTSYEIDTSVPYVWNTAFNAQAWDNDLYIHVEEPSKVYWWSIIMCDDCVYFCNLDTSSDWIKGIEYEGGS